MTSRPHSPARRKSAHERRSEIVRTASEIALVEGLESLTLRRVADALAVFPGLVNHYFRSVDDLVAAAFGYAAGQELDELFGMLDSAESPLTRTREVLRLLVSEDRDQISLLWLDAWHAVRRRPALRTELNTQALAWQSRLADLIDEGVRSGAFRTKDAAVVAMRVLAMIDGLSVQAAMRSTIDYDAVRELVFAITERELGLRAGELHPS
jgi:AcrR family transcriptional regulator